MVNVLVTIPIHHSGSCKYAKPPVAAPLLQIDATWSSEKMCDVVHCSVQSKLATWHSPIHKRIPRFSQGTNHHLHFPVQAHSP